MDLIYTLDLAGTFVFAISGILTAANKKFDVFGAFVIAFVTALGGGTTRDVLIGVQPVSWMLDLNYLLVIGIAIIVSYFFLNHIQRLRKTMFLFDTIGIALFTILGLQKTLVLGISPIIALMMGIVSAVFGGVIRDVLCGEIPLIFRKEIYATVCLIGGVLFLALTKLNVNYDISVWSTVLFIIVLRTIAVRRHWSLPFVS